MVQRRGRRGRRRGIDGEKVAGAQCSVVMESWWEVLVCVCGGGEG